MLRHGCGYALANAGHDTRALQAWLGHKNSTDLQRQSGDNIAARILIPVT
jgi:integrase